MRENTHNFESTHLRKRMLRKYHTLRTRTEGEKKVPFFIYFIDLYHFFITPSPQAVTARYGQISV